MSRPSKRSKTEPADDGEVDRDDAAMPDADDDESADAMYTQEQHGDEDPLASIAAFLAPAPSVKRQPSAVFFEQHSNDAAAAAEPSLKRKAAASRKGKAVAADVKPVKRQADGFDEEGNAFSDADLKPAALAGADDAAAADERKRKAKKRHRPNREIASTQKLSYMSQHGLLASSLPMFSALTRERLLQHDIPAAAQCLRALYPAYRLDVDTVFKASVEVLERHLLNRAADENDGGSAVQQREAGTQQLTRFYRKMINLQPKNALQVGFELAFLFLSQGQVQEAFDHLSSWANAPGLSHNESALGLIHAYLGVVAWEAAKQARAEAQAWTARLRRQQDGDDDVSEASDASGVVAGLSHTLSQRHAQSSADMLREARTSSEKAVMFEKTARMRLGNAIKMDRSCSTWLVYYLEAVHSQQSGEEDGSGVPAAAVMSAKSRASSSRRSKRGVLSEMLTAIDEHIAVTLTSATGFHLKLHYLSLFRAARPRQSLSLEQRQQLWLCIRQLAQRDPVSNLAATHAWQLWREQGGQERTMIDGAAGSDEERKSSQVDASGDAPAVALASSSEWCIRTSELIDMLAVRLDFQPTESWSWRRLASLLAASLGIEPASMEAWTRGYDDDEEALPLDDSSRIAGADPNAAARRVTESLDDARSIVSSGDSQLSVASRRKRLDFPRTADESSAEAAATPVLAPSASPLAPQRVASSASLDSHSLASAPSRSPSVLDDRSAAVPDGANPVSSRIFPHNSLASFPLPTESERRDVWSGRIEWWVQAEGWWRNVKQIDPQRTTPTPRQSQVQRLSELRGVCLWMILRWMKWI